MSGAEPLLPTYGNVVGKIIIGPFFGFAAGWIIDKFGSKRLMIFGILICGFAVIGLSRMASLGYMCGGRLPNQHIKVVQQIKRQSHGHCIPRH